MLIDEEYETEVRNCLKFPSGMIHGPLYMLIHKHLAKINILRKNELQAIYHLTEAHGAGIRQQVLFQDAKNNSGQPGESSISFKEIDKNEEVKGLFERLAELPEAWTIVQLTREFEPSELFAPRLPETTPQLKETHITRLPCGKREEEVPVMETVTWEGICDLIQAFWNVKVKLVDKCPNAAQNRKIRAQISSDVESYMREIGGTFFQESIIFIFGRLFDKALESNIRSRINNALDSSSVKITKRMKYVSYLLGENCSYLDSKKIERMVKKLVPDALHTILLETVLYIKENFPSLSVVKRHPVIFVLDDRLEVISWESIVEMRRHPISRVPSLHLVQRLYRMHKKWINEEGLREVKMTPEGPGFFVIDPEGDLPSVQERLSPFFAKRIPNWKGLVGKKPTEEEIIEALKKAPTYIYCGHGSGCQYVHSESIQNLKLEGVQLLYGCGSASLKDWGGAVEMTGDVLQFLVAGSGCTLGMLWAVTTNDTDKMTMTLANIWLPGTQINIESLEEIPKSESSQEPELLRAIRGVRDCVINYYNGAALIARGIPIKLTST